MTGSAPFVRVDRCFGSLSPSCCGVVGKEGLWKASHAPEAGLERELVRSGLWATRCCAERDRLGVPDECTEVLPGGGGLLVWLESPPCPGDGSEGSVVGPGGQFGEGPGGGPGGGGGGAESVWSRFPRKRAGGLWHRLSCAVSRRRFRSCNADATRERSETRMSSADHLADCSVA